MQRKLHIYVEKKNHKKQTSNILKKKKLVKGVIQKEGEILLRLRSCLE